MLSGIGLTRRHAGRVLAAGLAGEPVRTSSSLLFDEAAVRELAARPVVPDVEVEVACPTGLFIARRDVPVNQPGPAQREALQRGWAFSAWTTLWLRMAVVDHGSLPLVATVGGFVTTGADLLDAVPGPGGYVLDLREPGAWFESLRGRRLLSGRGREWAVRGWRPYAAMGESAS